MQIQMRFLVIFDEIVRRKTTETRHTSTTLGLPSGGVGWQITEVMAHVFQFRTKNGGKQSFLWPMTNDQTYFSLSLSRHWAATAEQLIDFYWKDAYYVAIFCLNLANSSAIWRYGNWKCPPKVYVAPCLCPRGRSAAVNIFLDVGSRRLLIHIAGNARA